MSENRRGLVSHQDYYPPEELVAVDNGRLEKRVGEPCPQCQGKLERGRSTFRTTVEDVAYCPRCCSSWELHR